MNYLSVQEKIQAVYLSIVKYLLIIPFFLIMHSVHSQSFEGVKRLADRRFPFLKDKVVFHSFRDSRDLSPESYRIFTANDKLVIEASSRVAAATGLNHYLKQYCGKSISRGGENIRAIKRLPPVPDTVTNSTPFQYRYALNYCTYNYTYSFYDWQDWEWELDWMALNGVNLMLAPMGTEAIWQHVLSNVGYNDQEIKQFIPGPAFNAWWLMGNLQGWGGPVNDAQIRQWTQLQQKLLARMSELGITPVMQGFQGVVPAGLKAKYPDARIIEQGAWAGGFKRPAVLLPSDPLFRIMAAAYYSKMKELYGDSIDYLGGDLFHEGGNTAGVDIRDVAHGVQEAMQEHFPGSVWVLQGWGGNPKKELLAGLSPENTLIINLFGESKNNRDGAIEFGDFPWVWGSVNNFGGKVGMGAQLPTLLSGPHQALSKSKNGRLQGIGILPEGIDNNPVAYDIALAAAWLPTNSKTDDYLKRYLKGRYGRDDDELVYRAWTKLLKSLYGAYSTSSEGGFESIFCARPGLEITNVSTWGPKKIQYDPALPLEALRLLRQRLPRYQHSETYRYDLTDLSRQVLADYGRTVYSRVVKAFKEKDRIAFQQYSSEFLDLIKLQDRLLGTHPEFMLGPWLARAKKFAEDDPYREEVNEKNARMLITYWGADNSDTDLHDYAHREWSGLLKDLYLPRWESFFSDLAGRLNGEPSKGVNYFEMEKEWTTQSSRYPVSSTGNYRKIIDEVVWRVTSGMKADNLMERTSDAAF